MSAEMIAIIAWPIVLAALLVPDMCAMRRDLKQMLETVTRMDERLRRMAIGKDA